MAAVAISCPMYNFFHRKLEQTCRQHAAQFAQAEADTLRVLLKFLSGLMRTA